MNINFNQTSDFDVLEKIKSSGTLNGKKYHVVTFGCQQNEADSEKIRGILTEMGCAEAERAECADILLMNTCAIREHAEMKALSILGNFSVIKRDRPSVIIGVLGCMAAEPSRAESLKSKFRYVDFTLEPSRLHMLPTVMLKAMAEKKRSFILGEGDDGIVEQLPIKRVSSYKAYVSIMYGCNNFCTYCIVPYVRGRERSRESATVIDECRELVRSGIKEITLLGQNVNSYRSDMSFAELISAIAEIDGDFIIRFMTSHPKDVSPELIEAMKRYKGKIAPCFHLPVQSGSNRILSAMNRKYTRESYLKTVESLRRAIPDIALSTDIIIGFPGESDEDFDETLALLSEVGFDMVYTFLYSPRSGTRAALMENRVERDVMDRRMSRLLEMQKKISAERNLPMVGRTVRVLVESDAPSDTDGTYTARAANGKLVRFKSDACRAGEFRTVKIESAGIAYLIGSETKN